jgi:hypothetical protein
MPAQVKAMRGDDAPGEDVIAPLLLLATVAPAIRFTPRNRRLRARKSANI